MSFIKTCPEPAGPVMNPGLAEAIHILTKVLLIVIIMTLTKVNVATLKSQLSKYLEIVRHGEEIIITSHGEEIARIVPFENKSVQPIDWQEYLKSHKPLKTLKKPVSFAKIIRQIRDEE